MSDPCIFVLDDDEDLLEFVDLVLVARGFNVEIFSQPAVFLKRMSLRRPDVILIDIRMPGMSGHQVFREIRQCEQTIPIIVISASDRQEDAVEALRLGAFDFLRKPLKDFVIVNAVKRALIDVSNASPAEPAAAPSSAERPHDRRVLDVLLADDDESNRRLIEAYLRNTPYRLVLTASGAEALERFEAKPFHIVLMDLRMPDIDGLTATRRIREIEKRQGRSRTPVIALTAHALTHNREASMEAGCDAHVTKPVLRATLLTAIYELTKTMEAPAWRHPEPSSPTANADVTESLRVRLPDYVAARGRDVEELTRALETGDLKASREIGHKLKGTGSSYGFERVTELGTLIENASEEGKKDGVASATSQLKVFIDMLRKPIPGSSGASQEGVSFEAPSSAALQEQEEFVLCALTYDVDPVNRRHGQGRQFFAEAFASISTLRADGVCSGRVDRIQAVLSHIFTPGIAFLGCLVPAQVYAEAIWREKEFVEGPLVIGIHSFHYGAGHADWSGELGTLRIPLLPPPENMRIWSGAEEKGFASVYGQDLRGFARGMGLAA